MGLLAKTGTQQAYHDGNDHGNYQFTSLDDVINQFIIAYVGEDKIISKAKRTDVAFHAQRAMQELSFDTFKSCKAQEITVPATLQMTLPQDYVNYTKVSWVDSAGIKHLLYPTSKTSNPSSNPLQDSAGSFTLQAVGDLGRNVNTVTLDDEYKDIVVGMVVTGPITIDPPPAAEYIPAGTLVGATTNSGGVTTIELQDATGADVFPGLGLSGATLTFTKQDGTLILPQKSAHIVETLSWNLTDFKITAAAASDFADIEIGMIVSHDYFAIGTKVVNVYNDVVVVDRLPTVASGTAAGEVTFISSDVDTDTWANYKSATPSEINNDDYEDDTYWPLDGQRYGLDPQHAQANGSFYIDCVSVSNIAGFSGKSTSSSPK